jgi:hypothetical protein
MPLRCIVERRAGSNPVLAIFCKLKIITICGACLRQNRSCCYIWRETEKDTLDILDLWTPCKSPTLDAASRFVRFVSSNYLERNMSLPIRTIVGIIIKQAESYLISHMLSVQRVIPKINYRTASSLILGCGIRPDLFVTSNSIELCTVRTFLGRHLMQ